jgi:hypothetical protein
MTRIARLFGAPGAVAVAVLAALPVTGLAAGASGRATPRPWSQAATAIERVDATRHAQPGRAGGAPAPLAVPTFAVANAMSGPAGIRRLPPLPRDFEAVAATSPPDVDGVWLVDAAGRVVAFGEVRGTDARVATDADRDPVVGIAAASPRGYWIVTASGVVRAVGATDHGSLGADERGGRRVVGIAPFGSAGYWLLTDDGAVHAFGDAPVLGGAAHRPVRSRFVAIAARPDGVGYYLVTRRGSVFGFGDGARHLGDPHRFTGLRVVGVATDPDGVGYWLALDTGAVLSYGARRPRPGFANWTGAPSVAIVARPNLRYATYHGRPLVDHLHPFLVCTRSHESSQTAPAFDDGYRVLSPSGRYRGAYQFSRPTWDHTAANYGRPDLAGVDPIDAVVDDQDHLAYLLYRARGAAPWMGRCAGS